jgi:MFS family permease
MGFALAPMVLAPLSEMNGRYPVFVVAGAVYVVFQAVCGVVTTLEGMLVARFMVGAGASVFSTLVGGVIADMWDAKGRNTPMAVFSGSVLAGTGAGPLVAAVMAERMAEGERWKWIFWHQVVMGGVTMVLLVVFFRESRGSVLLSWMARGLNMWYVKLVGEG